MGHLLLILLLVRGSFGKFLCASHETDIYNQGTCYQIEQETASHSGESGNLLHCHQAHMFDPPPRKVFQCQESGPLPFFCSYEAAYFSQQKLTYQKAKEACADLGLPMFAPETTEEWYSVRHYIPQYWYSNEGRNSHTIWIAMISKDRILFWNRRIGEERRVNSREIAFEIDDPPHDGISSAAIQWDGVSHRVTFLVGDEEANFICGTLQPVTQRAPAKTTTVHRSSQAPTTGSTELGKTPRTSLLKWEHIALVASILVFAAIVVSAVIVKKRRGRFMTRRNAESGSEPRSNEPSWRRPPFRGRTLPGKTASNKSYLDAGDIATRPHTTANGSVHLYESLRGFGSVKPVAKVDESDCKHGHPELTRQRVFNESGQYEIPFTIGVTGYVSLDAVHQPDEKQQQSGIIRMPKEM